jgi:hypothetical protein
MLERYVDARILEAEGHSEAGDNASVLPKLAPTHFKKVAFTTTH